MRKKAENDLAAFARSIADKRGRNADWAEAAVRESVSITETAALEKHVIDLIADDVPALLAQLDGKTISIAGTEKTLRTVAGAGAVPPDELAATSFGGYFASAVCAHVAQPGVYGIAVELYNPGLIFPGVIGAISLLLAFYSLQTLPINYAGLLLIGLGMLLFILEVKVTSFGMLTIGGLVSMFLGSLMLVDSPVDYLRIPLATIFLVGGVQPGSLPSW